MTFAAVIRKAKLGSSVETAEITAGAVTAAKLATDAVETAKIKDDAITLAKMAAGTANKIIGYDGSGDPEEKTEAGGAWSFVEEHIVSGSDEASFDFSATLTGDTDGGYMIVGLHNSKGGVTKCFLRINGASAVVTGNRLYQNNTTVSGTDITDAQMVVDGSSAGGTCVTMIPISEKDLLDRSYMNQCDSFQQEQYRMTGKITTPANNVTITSLGVAADGTTGLEVGSVFRLYKLVKA